MATIRLYKKFYEITISKNGDLYNLIDPVKINATTYLKDSTIIVEDIITINRDSIGIYYVDLNPSFYSYDNSYDLKWIVQYLNDTSFKTLTMSFKLNPIINGNGGEIYTEIEDQIIEVIILQNEQYTSI